MKIKLMEGKIGWKMILIDSRHGFSFVYTPKINAELGRVKVWS